jgi:hypothetical protein
MGDTPITGRSVIGRFVGVPILVYTVIQKKISKQDGMRLFKELSYGKSMVETLLQRWKSQRIKIHRLRP